MAYAAPLETVKKYFAAIGAEEYELAKSLIEEISFTGEKGLRMREHYRAQLLMKRREHREAILILNAATQKYGPYIGVMVDLGTCYYACGSFRLYRSLLEDIKSFLFVQNHVLQISRRVRYTLWLVKHLEDLGEVSAALEALDHIEQSCSTLLEPEDILKVEIQQLRIRSTFEADRRVSEAYEAVQKHLAKIENPRLKTEALSAMMLAEIQLFGTRPGEMRLRQICALQETTPREKDFVLADFLYAAAIFGGPETKAIKILDLQTAIPRDSFEKLIFDWFFSSRLTLEDLQFAAPSLSWAAQLRLFLVLAKNSSPADIEEIRSRIQLLLQGLDKNSRTAWIKLLKISSSQLESGPLNFSFAGNQITLNDQLIKTGPLATTRSLITAFSGKSTWDTGELCERLWSNFVDANSLARLKMLAKRLNEEIFESTGRAGFIKVTKSETVSTAAFSILQNVVKLKKTEAI